MLEHLVQSHLGGYYISDGDPEFIEQYCETCGDYDYILTSWNSEEENARVNALLKFFTISSLNSKKDLDNKVEEYKGCSLDINDIIDSIIADISFNNEEIDSIITSLFESKEISENEYSRILNISNFNEDRQIKMVKHFEESYYPKEINKNVKKLTKRINRKTVL